MRTWLRYHKDAFLTSFRRLRHAPANTLLAALALGIVLALPATGEMLILNFMHLAGLVSTKPQISVFMSLDASAATVSEVGNRLAQHPGVRESRLVPRSEALARLKRNEGMAAVIDSLPQNPLPDAYIVTPVADAPTQLEALKRELAKLPKVDQVQLDSAWVKRLDALLGLLRAALVVLAGLLAVALIAVTFNTIRLQILLQKEEIEVMRLLGASNDFIYRPFYYTGLLQGLAGGGLAWLLVRTATDALREPVGNLASAFSLDLSLAYLPPGETALLFALSLLLGYLGTWLSLRRFLR